MAMDQQYTDMLKELEAVKKERDALAAHVERLQRDMYEQAYIVHREFGVKETVEDYLPKSYNESPSIASLARRDALKQIAAFEAALAAFDSDPNNAQQMIEGMLIHSQRQAEGEAHE
jgi:hypothetical protein